MVLAVPLLLVLVVARVLTGSSDGKDPAADTATQAGAVVQPPADAPIAGPTAAPTTPPEPVLAEPSGPCADSDIVATPTLTSAVGGADVPITINLRTVATEACTWQASPQTLTVTITSGNDFIWSTRECPAAIAPQDVVVRQAVDTPVTVTWKGAKRSDETCSNRTTWALPGFYHVESAALGGDGTDVQFELLGTQTATSAPAAPQPEATATPGGKKNGNGGNGGKKKNR